MIAPSKRIFKEMPFTGPEKYPKDGNQYEPTHEGVAEEQIIHGAKLKIELAILII